MLTHKMFDFGFYHTLFEKEWTRSEKDTFF